MYECNKLLGAQDEVRFICRNSASYKYTGEKTGAQQQNLGASCAVTLSRRIIQEKIRAHSCKIWAQHVPYLCLVELYRRKYGCTAPKFGRSRLFSTLRHNKNADGKHTKMSPSDGQERNNGGLGWQYDAQYRCKYKWQMRWCLHWTDNTFPLLQEQGKT